MRQAPRGATDIPNIGIAVFSEINKSIMNQESNGYEKSSRCICLFVFGNRMFYLSSDRTTVLYSADRCRLRGSVAIRERDPGIRSGEQGNPAP
jgi:hypothetical protein